ncbi:MAG: valine--tRNA ligase [Planctomycetota bacterium]
MTDLPKAYTPADHEPRVRERWDDSRAFHADPGRVLSGEARPYTVLIPPPNVTAALHLGHALNNTLQDVLVRAHRMKGYETLWMPGTDHAGIATQTVVDKRLREAGEPGIAEYKRREAEGEPAREEFVAKVQAWKDEYKARITDQLKAMGCSCDWSRQRFTMDEICARAVREAFFRLFKDGLIYRGKRLVNWDPVTQTALADDEVESRDVDGHFYFLRYPLVHEAAPGDHNPVTWEELAARGYPGAEEHPGDDEAWITIATTRPETYLGDTAVAVNPKDPRATAVRGMKVQLPLVGRVIPIVEDDYVVMPVKYGGDENDPTALMATGFLKVTPAHYQNDWEIGNRHDLERINIMAPDASISDQHGWEDVGYAHIFVGLSRKDARKKVVEEFQARTLNDAHPLLEDIKPHRHAVGHSYRSHVPVEPYLSDQWYCKVTDDRLRGYAQRALKTEQRTSQTHAADTRIEGDSDVTFYPPRYAKTYETWHDDLRDWCISRQLWWGHRIPVWSLRQLERESHFDPPHGAELKSTMRPLVDRLLELERGGRISAIRHFDSIGVPLVSVRPEEMVNFDWQELSVCVLNEWDSEAIEFVESMGFTQDPDVLDTWFSSALWALSTLGWPNADLPRFHPKQIDQGDDSTVNAVYAKRVGTWKDFIGVDGEKSGELIDTLLVLRDLHKKTGGEPVLAYQLFSEADLEANGQAAMPLLAPDDIQQATDLVCAVAVKTTEPVKVVKRSVETVHDIPAFLLSHGFQDTAGLLAAFNPTSVLCTAREIITLWVSRMVMFNRYFLEHDGKPGQHPFHDVFIHAMIQDGEGRKMSKSLGNGVDPLDIIDSHGTDSMRFTLVQMTTNTQDVRMPVERDETTGKNTSPKFDLGRNFCNKLWNAARFALSMLEGTTAGTPVPRGDLTLPDKWLLTRIARTEALLTDALTKYTFKEFADACYDLLWRDFCDWYLEAIKPTVKASAAQQATLRAGLDAILRLLHPMIPFVTETIAEKLGEVASPGVEGLTLTPARRGCLASAGWPECDASLLDEVAEARLERIRSLAAEINTTRAKHQVKPKRKITVHLSASLVEDLGTDADYVRTLAGVETITADAPAGDAVAFVFEGAECKASDLADAVDAEQEKAALGTELAKLEKQLKTLDGRLSNPGYVEKAPEKMVNETKQQRAETAERIDAIRARLGELG